MNYRHIYHAGNFADVMKHWVLVLCLEYLKKKDKGFCAIDAHGGIGFYNLESAEAQKTKEYESGIATLAALTNPPDELKSYLAMVKKDLAKNKYPGSPMIIARHLRNQDRLIANELHPDDYKTLKMTMGSHINTSIENRDAYECLRSHLPPAERRGLILIDPPFEKPDEFEKLARQTHQWAKRFPTGTYLIWYPVKAHLPVESFKKAVFIEFSEVLCFETLRYPADRPDSFNGSGLLIVNPPYGLDGQLRAAAPVLQQCLNLHECRINMLESTPQG